MSFFNGFAIGLVWILLGMFRAYWAVKLVLLDEWDTVRSLIVFPDQRSVAFQQPKPKKFQAGEFPLGYYIKSIVMVPFWLLGVCLTAIGILLPRLWTKVTNLKVKRRPPKTRVDEDLLAEREQLLVERSRLREGLSKADERLAELNEKLDEPGDSVFRGSPRLKKDATST